MGIGKWKGILEKRLEIRSVGNNGRRMIRKSR